MASTTDETIALRLLLIRDLATNYASICHDTQLRQGFVELSRMADEAQRLLPQGS